MAESKSGFWSSKLAHALATLVFAYAGIGGKALYDESQKKDSFRDILGERFGVPADDVPTYVARIIKLSKHKVYIYMNEDEKARYHHYNDKEYDVIFNRDSGHPYFVNDSGNIQMCFTNKNPRLNP